MRFTKFNMMMMAVMVGALLAPAFPSLQAQTASQGGSFLPTQDYTVTGRWTMSGGVAISGTSTIAAGATLTSPTITGATLSLATLSAPVISGTVTGTYTLGGTPTITSPAITSPTITGTPTIVLQDSTTTLVDDGDATKIVKWQTSGLTTATTRTWTWQDSSDTIVGRATTDTLTNKTLTAPVIASIVNTGTLTLPTATGGAPVVLDCGSTTTGTATCTAAAAAVTTKVYAGVATLASNAQVITLPVAFAATTSFQCVGNDITTRANPVQVISTSASTITITNTTGASDVINWICVGQ